MVAGIHFYATPDDERQLLDFAMSSGQARLFPWRKMTVAKPTFFDVAKLKAQSERTQCYGIVDQTYGPIRFIGERPTELEPNHARTYVFDLMNWDREAPTPGEGIVNWNRTPALFWERGELSSDGEMGVGEIGSQADNMAEVSIEYRKWVNRVMSWVRRKGVKVAHMGKLTDDAVGLKFRIELLNTVYALPEAMEFFRAGGG